MMGKAIIIIGVAAVCTAFLRAVPFLVFGVKREVPIRVRRLGKILPAAIMATLAVYCLREVNLWQGTHGWPELIAVVLVVILHRWKKNILLTVSVSTVAYMLMIQVIFKYPA